MQKVRKIVLRKEHPDVSMDITNFQFYESDIVQFCGVCFITQTHLLKWSLWWKNSESIKSCQKSLGNRLKTL